MNGQELWLVGRITLTGQWEVQGLYANEDDAAERCEDLTWFVMPLTVGEHVPTATTFNPRGYYPAARP
jgi:hypothetical protein